MYKLIINQDVLLRTPITQVRRHIDVYKMKNKRRLKYKKVFKNKL
jgi:hypothetical protein